MNYNQKQNITTKNLRLHFKTTFDSSNWETLKGITVSHTKVH